MLPPGSTGYHCASAQGRSPLLPPRHCCRAPRLRGTDCRGLGKRAPELSAASIYRPSAAPEVRSPVRRDGAPCPSCLGRVSFKENGGGEERESEQQHGGEEERVSSCHISKANGNDADPTIARCLQLRGPHANANSRMTYCTRRDNTTNVRDGPPSVRLLSPSSTRTPPLQI